MGSGNSDSVQNEDINRTKLITLVFRGRIGIWLENITELFYYFLFNPKGMAVRRLQNIITDIPQQYVF